MSLIFIVVLYFIPSIVATLRKTRNAVQTFLVNLFFGITIIGWIIAFIMAFSDNRRK